MELHVREVCLAVALLTCVLLVNIPSAEGGRCLVSQGGVIKVNFTCVGGCCMNSDKGFFCCSGEEGVGFGMGFDFSGNPRNQNAEATTKKVMTTTSGGEIVKHRPLCPILLLTLVLTLYPCFR